MKAITDAQILSYLRSNKTNLENRLIATNKTIAYLEAGNSLMSNEKFPVKLHEPQIAQRYIPRTYKRRDRTTSRTVLIDSILGIFSADPNATWKPWEIAREVRKIHQIEKNSPDDLGLDYFVMKKLNVLSKAHQGPLQKVTRGVYKLNTFKPA
jgi:hypothetical protein